MFDGKSDVSFEISIRFFVSPAAAGEIVPVRSLAFGYGLNDFPLIIRNCLLNTIVSTATEHR